MRKSSCLSVGTLLASLLALMGCEKPGDSRSTPFVMRDSGAVRITENAGRPMRGGVLELGPEPNVRIGCAFCDDEWQLFGWVPDVIRLSDGRIAVLDLLAREVRVFNPDGTRSFSFGRQGQGPGEFISPDRMAQIRGDSIVVHDQGRFAQQVYSVDGEFGRSVQDPKIPAWRNLWDLPRGWLADGAFFVADEIHWRELPVERGVAHAEWRLFGPDGQELAVVADLPAVHGIRIDPGDGPVVDGKTAFSPRRTYHVDRTGFWYGFPSSYEVIHVRRDGTVDRIIRRAWNEEPVGASFRRSYRSWLEESIAERWSQLNARGRESLTRELEALELAEAFPAFRRLIGTVDGGVWVEEYPSASQIEFDRVDRFGPRGRAEWSVFDERGRWIRNVRVPERFSIHEIGPDYVLGVSTDSLGVRYVDLYDLPPSLSP